MYRLDEAEHIAGRLDRVPRGQTITDQVDCEAHLVPQYGLRELEQDATEERLMRYTRGYIMQLIGDILFPDASDSRVHIKWLPLLEDLDTCGQLSWGSAVLAWLYR
ncbi:hypothetical protein Ahy_B03g066307 [Arachis hypogaea]|uniref:Aminotransferase-like plant mobile domain-containing protein n=1 Tax=Arachis hypogaea TaxID=3818 RepID=A0A445A3Q5_ARAHY|nr:hypothetical protein Ahy_B03g066307 [Arachis hypogaea]